MRDSGRFPGSTEREQSKESPGKEEGVETKHDCNTAESSKKKVPARMIHE